MTVAFLDRNPTVHEIEKLRLILSTYQDGTGMLINKQNTQMTLPGWRDFERAAALAFNGDAQESKSIFDVLLKDGNTCCGISCKMRGELNKLDKIGRASIELSNSAGKFWEHLYTKRITQKNYRRKPAETGIGLIELIEEWHRNFSLDNGFEINLDKSCFLVLSWNKQGWYQLHQFPFKFPDPKLLKWYCPDAKTDKAVRRIVANDESGVIFEWYGESGGQLKYYPLVSNAIWSSERFNLEPLDNSEHGILTKVAAYFPKKWLKVSS